VLSIRPRLDSLGRLVVLGVIAAGVGAIQLIPSAVLWTQSVRLGGLTPDDLFRHTAMPFDLLGTAFANVFVKFNPAGQDLNSTWLPGGAWGPLEGGSYIGLAMIVLAAVAVHIRRARPLVVVSLFMIGLPIVGGTRPSWWLDLPIWNSLHAPVKGYMFLDLMIVLLAAIGLGRLRHHRAGWKAPSIAGAVLVGGYLLLVGVVLVTPDLFRQLVTRFWAWPPPGNEQVVWQEAANALTVVWPVGLEIALGIVVILLVRSNAAWRRGVVLGAVILPLALLSPSVNQLAPESSFNIASSVVGRALTGLQPSRVLTMNGPAYWWGTPNQFAAAGIPDIAMFSSLSLAATESLLAQLRTADQGQLTARAVGIDTVASVASACPGTAVTTVDAISICHLDALVAPYWVPSSVAVVQADSGTSFLKPAGATFYVDRAIQSAKPALVENWSSTSATMLVDAPEDGWLFIDRAWWPGWQVTVDGVAQDSARALAGQLVSVKAGVHVVEQRLVLWDVQAGLALSLLTLLGIAVALGVPSRLGRRLRSLSRAAALLAPRDGRLP
jgi:hypothetical protein